MSRPRSTLLGCGLDIRLLIYEYLFAMGQEIYLTRDVDLPAISVRSAKYKLEPRVKGLMRSCRLIHGEMAGLIYGRNIFYLTPRDDSHNGAVG